MKLKDVYKVEVTNLDHQGRGIAKIEGIITFIPNTLKEEIAKVEITTSKKKYAEGRLLEIVKTSKNRIKPICSYFEECGGCDLMHMTYTEQLEYKEEKVKNIISKYNKLDNVVKDIVPSPNELYYRNKLTIQVKEKIGLYKKKSYDIIPIDKCLITNKQINECIPRIRLIKDLKNINQIIVRVSNTNNELMIILEVSDMINEMPWITLGREDNINIILHNKKGYKTLVGNSYIDETLNEYKFKISPSAFFQINNKQTINLFNKIKTYINKGDKILDLYCGIGSIGIYLSDIINELVGIEINDSAINDANINKNINNVKNATFYVGDVGKALSKINFKPNSIIVDPPRSGLSIDTINEIIKLNPNKIIYVSCDPITLSRDLNILKEKYIINEITPFDMFPNTYHIETLTLLEHI